MAEPFKNSFNAEMIADMGRAIHAVYPKFDMQGFVQMSSSGLDALELKQRSHHISLALETFLPSSFDLACEIIRASLPSDGGLLKPEEVLGGGIRGWGIMAINGFIARVGGARAENFDIAMQTLAQTTRYFTSEFAVRTFIIADANRAMQYFLRWAEDENYHLRRLASEGSRPRLPWGQQLPMFVADPTPTLVILEKLKSDPHEYVRRSVANHLNDIAKDHPDLVAKLTQDWLAEDDSKNRLRLVRHACRTLIKQGHSGALSIFGYHPPKITPIEINIQTPIVKMGERLSFAAALKSESAQTQSLMIDFIIHHVKANGKTSPKVFKWKTAKLAVNQTLQFEKSHTIKPISTRKYYSGTHYVELQINGAVMGRGEFELQV